MPGAHAKVRHTPLTQHELTPWLGPGGDHELLHAVECLEFNDVPSAAWAIEIGTSVTRSVILTDASAARCHPQVDVQIAQLAATRAWWSYR